MSLFVNAKLRVNRSKERDGNHLTRTSIAVEGHNDTFAYAYRGYTSKIDILHMFTKFSSSRKV
jgi:hypothetical protein